MYDHSPDVHKVMQQTVGTSHTEVDVTNSLDH